MRFYRCKCGKSKAWGSMSPDPCDGCDECGTTLEQSPEYHTTPEPHEFVETQVQTDDGPKPLTKCRWCGRTKVELERKTNKESESK